jgi:osmoprotectant transport system permease protein
VPAAALALIVDGALAGLERLLRPGRPRAGVLAAFGVAGLVLILALVWPAVAQGRRTVVTVGSKNFTEQIILGEILAQVLEREGVPVNRKLNLGGTFICDRAVRSGDIDLYVEYTGTAVTAVFHETVPHDPVEALTLARARYAAVGLTAGDRLGFDNTFAILVRGADARAHGLRSIEDLRRVAAGWTPGFGYEFLQRADGYPGLVKAYGLTFGSAPRAMELSLIYKALASNQVDVIAGDATSALIDALDLARLDDTLRYFPPYDAVPVVRTAALLKHPAIGRALARVAGRISERDMRAMNRAVDVDRKDPKTVASEFLGTR